MPYQGSFLFGAKVWMTSFMLNLPAVVGLAVETCLGLTEVESLSESCLPALYDLLWRLVPASSRQVAHAH